MSKASAKNTFISLFKESKTTFWELFKIMAPLVIVVKLFKEWGFDHWIGEKLSPMMESLGLPGETGLVWASAMITNLYGGMVTFHELGLSDKLSVSQVTVLASCMLIAHNLLVEIRIAQASGIKASFMAGYRILNAFFFGWILYQSLPQISGFQEPASVLWKPEASLDLGLWTWPAQQAKQFAMIFLLIFSLLAFLRFLRFTGVLRWIEKGLKPLFRPLAIGPQGMVSTLVGLTLGLAYGGGLLIREAHSGRCEPREILGVHLVIGLTHSLIEDVILMTLLGAHFLGIVVLKVLYTWISAFILLGIHDGISGSLRRLLFFRDIQTAEKRPLST
jgi:hypothetical protein